MSLIILAGIKSLSATISKTGCDRSSETEKHESKHYQHMGIMYVQHVGLFLG